jgi:hypothetical protein
MNWAASYALITFLICLLISTDTLAGDEPPNLDLATLYVATVYARDLAPSAKATWIKNETASLVSLDTQIRKDEQERRELDNRLSQIPPSDRLGDKTYEDAQKGFAETRKEGLDAAVAALLGKQPSAADATKQVKTYTEAYIKSIEAEERADEYLDLLNQAASLDSKIAEEYRLLMTNTISLALGSQLPNATDDVDRIASDATKILPTIPSKPFVEFRSFASNSADGRPAHGFLALGRIFSNGARYYYAIDGYYSVDSEDKWITTKDVLSSPGAIDYNGSVDLSKDQVYRALITDSQESLLGYMMQNWETTHYAAASQNSVTLMKDAANAVGLKYDIFAKSPSEIVPELSTHNTIDAPIGYAQKQDAEFDTLQHNVDYTYGQIWHTFVEEQRKIGNVGLPDPSLGPIYIDDGTDWSGLIERWTGP